MTLSGYRIISQCFHQALFISEQCVCVDIHQKKSMPELPPLAERNPIVREDVLIWIALPEHLLVTGIGIVPVPEYPADRIPALLTEVPWCRGYCWPESDDVRIE